MSIFKLKKTPIMEVSGKEIIDQAGIPAIPIVRVKSIRYFRLDNENIRAEIIYYAGQVIQYYWGWHNNAWKYLKEIR